MRGLCLSWLLSLCLLLSSQGSKAAAPRHDLSSTSTTPNEVHVTVFIDCPAGEFVDPTIGAYYSTSATVMSTVTVTSYHCSPSRTAPTATYGPPSSTVVSTTSTATGTSGSSPVSTSHSSSISAGNSPPTSSSVVATSTGPLTSNPSSASSVAPSELTSLISIPSIGFITVTLDPGETTTVELPNGFLTTITVPSSVSSSPVSTNATPSVVSASSTSNQGTSTIPSSSSPVSSVASSSSEVSSNSSITSTQSAIPGGLTTTITFPGLPLITVTLAPGQFTTLSLPSGLQSTVWGPSAPPQTTTVVPLPSGQSTTVTLPTIGATTISISGAGLTTISVPSPSLQITVISLPNGPITTITLPASGATSISLPGVGTTVISVPPISITTSTEPQTSITTSTPITSPGSSTEPPTTTAPTTGSSSTSSSEGSSDATTSTSPTTFPASNPPPSSTTTQQTGTGAMPSDTDPTTGFMPLASLYVTVESIEYFVVDDGDEALVIMLDDDEGTEARVGPDRVTIGTATIVYPSPVISPTTITQEGHTITLRLRPYQSPTLGSTPQETQAAGLKILQSYANWGNEIDQPFTNFFQSLWNLFTLFSIPAGEQPPPFLGPLDSRLASVSETATALDSILSSDTCRAFQDFAIWAKNTYQVSNPGQAFTDWLTDILGNTAGPLIRNIGRTLPGALSKVQGLARMLSRQTWRSIPKLQMHLVKYKTMYIGGGTAGGGLAVAVGVTIATLVKSSGSTVVEPPKEKPKRSWYVKCNEGTYVDVYRGMIMWIDGAAGYQVGADPKFSNTGQGYFTTLDQEIGEAKMKQVERFPFVTWVDPHADLVQTELLRQYAPTRWPRRNDPSDDLAMANYTNVTTQYEQSKLGMETPNLDAVPAPLYESFWHRRLISMKSSDQVSLVEQPQYYRDESQGKGITVFVMDSGFDLSNIMPIEYRVQNKQPSEFSYVPPEHLLQPDRSDPTLWPPNSIADTFVDNGRMINGHGTGVAACAIGTRHGIASKADAYLVKVGSAISLNPTRDTWKSNPVYPCALDDAFHNIIKTIETRDLQGKAVINLSLGAAYWRGPPEVPEYFPKLDTVYQRHLDKLAQLGVLFVTSALNEGWGEPSFVPTGDSYPQVMGTKDNNMVTVGSVGPSGILQPWSSPEGTTLGGPQGSITIYAQGIGVETVRLGGIPAMERGNSFAAPQVAGLIAYFLALPENADRFKWTGNGYELCRRVKKYLVETSYRRVRLVDQHFPGYPPYPIPEDVNVAYNNAWGPQTLSDTLYAFSPACGNHRGPVTPNQDPRDPAYQCPAPLPFPQSDSPPSPTGNLTVTPITTTAPPGGSMTIPPPITNNGSTSAFNSSIPLTNTSTPWPWATPTGNLTVIPLPTANTSSTGTTAATTSTTTTTTSLSSSALPTIFYNPTTAAGCANDACSACASGFRQSCVEVKDKREVQCACVWESACARDQRKRGECDMPCPDPQQVRDCETELPDVDPVSYPNG
ncbi:hypothetical protein F5X99DRAFT_423089 [Biscogniauxia marginata]|nr:hypothetical protein F5X99DRAFT_423089 [Biscogniauxia marginata]